MKKNIELSSQIPTELDLINYFHSGSKSSEDYKIGTENEKFLFHKDSLCPLQYSDGPGIVDVFKIIIDQFHWNAIFDGDYVIVPFGKTKLTGVVWDHFETNNKKNFQTKNVVRKLKTEPLSTNTINFLNW